MSGRIARPRRRALPGSAVSWRPPSQRHWDPLSFGELARRGGRASFSCTCCVPGWEIDRVDFSVWPWRRYHNYPSGTSFLCLGCGRAMVVRLLDPTVPGTG